MEDEKKRLKAYLQSFLESKDPLVDLCNTVANIPFGEARTIEDVLEQNEGTCTGKHYLLQSCLHHLGIENRAVVCVFRWDQQSIQYPDTVTSILNEGAWGHGHNFVQVKRKDGSWLDVDVTFDPALKQYGFRSLPDDWDGTQGFVAVDPVITRWEGGDVAILKRKLLSSLSNSVRDRRERFLQALFEWVRTIRNP